MAQHRPPGRGRIRPVLAGPCGRRRSAVGRPASPAVVAPWWRRGGSATARVLAPAREAPTHARECGNQAVWASPVTVGLDGGGSCGASTRRGCDGADGRGAACPQARGVNELLPRPARARRSGAILEPRSEAYGARASSRPVAQSNHATARRRRQGTASTASTAEPRGAAQSRALGGGEHGRTLRRDGRGSLSVALRSQLWRLPGGRGAEPLRFTRYPE